MKKLIVTLIITALCAGYLYCGCKAVEMEAEAAHLREVIVTLKSSDVTSSELLFIQLRYAVYKLCKFLSHIPRRDYFRLCA